MRASNSLKTKISGFAATPDEQLYDTFWESLDETAFEELYERHAPQLIAYLRVSSMQLSQEDAQDITAGCFLKVVEDRSFDKLRGGFKQWLFTVATNAARDLKRTGRRVHQQIDDTISVLSGGTASMDASLMIEAALRSLPRVQRQIVILRQMEGFSVKETAQILDIKLGSVGPTLTRALNRMNRALNIRSEQIKPKPLSKDSRLEGTGKRISWSDQKRKPSADTHIQQLSLKGGGK